MHLGKIIVVSAALLAASIAPARAQSVSVNLGNFFGRIDIGGGPAPALIYPQPVVIQTSPYAVARQPIYLRVPPGQERRWARYCARYDACGQPVYFVRDDWYRSTYVPAHVHRMPPPPPPMRAPPPPRPPMHRGHDGRGWSDRGPGYGPGGDHGHGGPGPGHDRGDPRGGYGR